ncbi:3-hydroxyacyl-CoA dehydrogenase NAD-binding domain-containing protein [Sphingobium sp.]|uniref:3-hydroxyacyl-CoA dehydrogenase NAD-binding domain-containing protein n=1 Tax=Sphingobium sp. TaxID=1912891 RepID=UPI002C19419E|nr:3-hydroxyacyl-CoA dehydrogenase NAD-binding domain-containing protein [Sphingobium sp.]HUD93909.1 3-hydroxyacyl-CoA dehydrogenase NAD-binding domain-containing protein [Sphingobium sp.]
MTIKPEDAVRYEVRDRVALLTIDFPPVNAIGAPVRQGMALRMDQAASDVAVDAIVVVGANDRFIAGSDIREFGKPKEPPELATVLEKMERSAKPVIAAIDGHALGGGFEFAMAAPFRIAASRAKVGLVEVNLGLLPGGGGTQRLTRLAGPEVALDMILNARHVAAPQAKAMGIVDEVTDGDVTEAAIAFVQSKAAEGGPWPIAIERSDKVGNVDPKIFEDVRARNAAKWKGMVAQHEIVKCVEAATRLEPREGLAFEREAFQVCLKSPAREALIHLFFAERAAAKVDGTEGVKPREIRSVGIIGAGTMGGGIAMSIVNAGLTVKLLDMTQEAIDAGMARIRKNYDTSVSRGSTTQEKVDAALGRIETVLDYEAFADVDLVIEAVFESLEVKHDVFGKLDKVCKPGTVLATNTSALDIDSIAEGVSRPGDVIGLHFFSPANVMKLVEVVRGDLAAKETIVTAMNFAKTIGKVPVLAGSCFGFIGNRILHRYGAEGDLLLMEGATPWQIDNALKEFGFPMGIYLMRDMAGLDVSYRVRRNKAAIGELDMASIYYNPIADRICEDGDYGQKTGKGYYAYEGRTPSPRPDVETKLEQISAEKGIARSAISDEEIVWRILAAMVNEGAKIVEEGYAQRASDIDVTYAFGYGFPKYRGGPMFWAEQQGLDKVCSRIETYALKYPERWKPSGLLKDRA